MCSAMAANAEGIPARANVFDEQTLLSFLPVSSELAPKYSLQPETGHYLVKAGWPVVLKKFCHWKEADATICICCGANQEPGDPDESDDSWTSQQFFFCSNALIALARSLCKCFLAELITVGEADV